PEGSARPDQAGVLCRYRRHQRRPAHQYRRRPRRRVRDEERRSVQAQRRDDDRQAAAPGPGEGLPQALSRARFRLWPARRRRAGDPAGRRRPPARRLCWRAAGAAAGGRLRFAIRSTVDSSRPSQAEPQATSLQPSTPPKRRSRSASGRQGARSARPSMELGSNSPIIVMPVSLYRVQPLDEAIDRAKPQCSASTSGPRSNATHDRHGPRLVRPGFAEPWGTVIADEEAGATGGLYEILDPASITTPIDVTDSANGTTTDPGHLEKRNAAGSLSFESIAI